MNKKKILIVDDVKANIDILMQFLKDEYALVPTLSGEKALEIVEKIEVNLILLDIMMPNMNGYEVCKKLKTMQNVKDIPVIFITAKSDIESIKRAYEAGGVDYVTKPFQKKDILKKIGVFI